MGFSWAANLSLHGEDVNDKNLIFFLSVIITGTYLPGGKFGVSGRGVCHAL